MALLFALATGILLVAPASAKLKMSLTVSDKTPKIGQRVTVVLGAEQALDFNLKLITVAPGKGWYDVVGAVTGDASRTHARIPRDGFGVRVTRIAPNRWRATVTFPRAGRWQLVIPNEAPSGFMIPPPVVVRVVVRS
jgi:hypothetical protein